MTPAPAAPAVPLTAAVAAAAAERVRPNMRLLGFLALGHLVVDANQGALPAILPFLRSALDLSHTATGSIMLAANITFTPFYDLDVPHGEPRLVGTRLAIFLGAGAVGTLCAGPLADRVGVRRYVVSVFLPAVPVGAGVLVAKGAPVFVLLGAPGFVLVSTFTVSVVLGQACLPRCGSRRSCRSPASSWP